MGNQCCKNSKKLKQEELEIRRKMEKAFLERSVQMEQVASQTKLNASKTLSVTARQRFRRDKLPSRPESLCTPLRLNADGMFVALDPDADSAPPHSSSQYTISPHSAYLHQMVSDHYEVHADSAFHAPPQHHPHMPLHLRSTSTPLYEQQPRPRPHSTYDAHYNYGSTGNPNDPHAHTVLDYAADRILHELLYMQRGIPVPLPEQTISPCYVPLNSGHVHATPVITSFTENEATRSPASTRSASPMYGLAIGAPKGFTSAFRSQLCLFCGRLPAAPQPLPLPQEPWFFECLYSRAVAEHVLRMPGNRPGAFLVRHTQQHGWSAERAPYVLSLLVKAPLGTTTEPGYGQMSGERSTKQSRLSLPASLERLPQVLGNFRKADTSKCSHKQLLHYQIFAVKLCTHCNCYQYYIDRNTRFDSIRALVHFYSQAPNGLPVRLDRPCLPFDRNRTCAKPLHASSTDHASHSAPGELSNDANRLGSLTGGDRTPLEDNTPTKSLGMSHGSAPCVLCEELRRYRTRSSCAIDSSKDVLKNSSLPALCVTADNISTRLTHSAEQLMPKAVMNKHLSTSSRPIVIN